MVETINLQNYYSVLPKDVPKLSVDTGTERRVPSVQQNGHHDNANKRVDHLGYEWIPVVGGIVQQIRLHVVHRLDRQGNTTQHDYAANLRDQINNALVYVIIGDSAEKNTHKKSFS